MDNSNPQPAQRVNMGPHLGLLVAGWSLLLVLRFLFEVELWNAFWFLTLWFDVALIAVGLGLIGSVHWALSRSQKAWRNVVVVAVITIGSVAYLTDVFDGAGARFRFWRLQDDYAEIVKLIEDRTLPLNGTYNGIDFQTEKGSELRMAFSWGGILDNWYGVVYDPTGLVLQVNADRTDSPQARAPGSRNANELFGGVLYSARPLGGHWYMCYWT
jgi:hypothetical protein